MLLRFCIFLLNLKIDLELDCIIGKPMNDRFQRYIVRMEILLTFYTRVIETMGTETPRNCPFPLGHVDSSLIHLSLD